MNIKPTYIDLFCGIGSFHYSFKKLGWKCLMACDIDNNAREVYKLNYDMTPLSDIRNIDPKSIIKNI
jgi:Site-specific DNA methylase